MLGSFPVLNVLGSELSSEAIIVMILTFLLVLNVSGSSSLDQMGCPISCFDPHVILILQCTLQMCSVSTVITAHLFPLEISFLFAKMIVVRANVRAILNITEDSKTIN